MAIKMADEGWLRNVFAQVDKDRSGFISDTELQSALSNGTWKPFDIQTVRIFIKMFDKKQTGNIDFTEFHQLWKYVTDWLNCFHSFDSDRSGSIGRDELSQALTTFGYRLSPPFLEVLLKKYGTIDAHGQYSLYFDNFVHLAVSLQTLTNAFRGRDTQMQGVITIGYEDFLTIVLTST